LPCKPT